jgi:tRNA nucleotidyltransferase (CCA-adding enzyme)
MPSIRFENALDAQQLTLLKALGRAAAISGTKLWAVGGVVRDALLGLPVFDIDLTSETPADQLGRTLSSTLGGSVSPITPFATVKLTIDSHHFDLATTRTETYPTPGTLPVVSLSSLDDDLQRRDFSVNAMAASLAPGDFGELLDPHGGRADLNAKTIRALHLRSFQDDPTRAFRAVRYATRLGFRIDPGTARWMRHDASLIERLSGTRARHEIERLLDEPRGAAALADAHRRGLLGHIHPALRANAIGRSLRAAAHSNLNRLELLGALMYPLSRSEVTVVASRLSLSRQQAILARTVVELREAEPQFSGAAPSIIDSLAGSAPTAAMATVAAVSPDPTVRASVRRYIRRSALVARHLDGDAIARIGVPSGPAIGEALKALRGAELDHIVRSERKATRFIQKWLLQR